MQRDALRQPRIGFGQAALELPDEPASTRAQWLSATIQHEVGERNRLPQEAEQPFHAAQARFNRTMEGRLRSLLRLLAQKFRKPR